MRIGTLLVVAALVCFVLAMIMNRHTLKLIALGLACWAGSELL